MCHMFADSREELITMDEGKRLVSEKLQVKFSENMDHEAVLFEYYKRMGKMKIHFCPSWDYMVIHANSPEFACCTCDKAALT